jgi:hypothetical protein
MHLAQIPCYAIATQERRRCEALLADVRRSITTLQAAMPVTQTHRMFFWVWDASAVDHLVTNTLEVADDDLQVIGSVSSDLPALREFLLHNNFPLRNTENDIQYVTRIGWWPCLSAVGCQFCLARPHFPTLDDERLKYHGHVNFFKQIIVKK